MIKQLSLQEWDGILIDAEVALLEDAPAEDKIKKLVTHIGILSNEVQRLRLTYGEPGLLGVNTTKEEEKAEQARYMKE